MPLTHPSRQRLRILAAGVGATALACAGLSLMISPSQAAPSSKPAPLQNSYRGAPVNPAPYTISQPDGSTLRVRDHGDHLQHWTSTVKGDYTVVKGSDGAYHYAAGLTSSGGLKPSSVVAGDGAAPAAAQGLVPAPTGRTTPNHAPLGGTGDDTELVILTQFTDVTHKAGAGVSDEAAWANHYFGATGSVDDFYEEATQNQFGLKPANESCGTANNGVVDWITLPYAHPNTGVDDNATEQYVADAIAMASSCVDYAQFDTNHDGELTTDELHVTVIGAGFETSYGGDDCGKSIWGHEWDLAGAGIAAPTVDGVKVGNSGYTTFGEWHCNAGDNPGHKATIGIMAHEFGHDINWPDLYDTDGSGEGIGEFSLMAGGSWGDNGGFPGNSPAWPDAWALYYQGWITPQAVTTATNDIQLAPHQAALLNPNPGNPAVDWLFNETEGNGEYYLVENRNHTGYDVSTPGCGLLVYRVDETVTPSNAANQSTNDPLVRVIQADNLNELTTGHNDRGDTGDPYPGSTGNTELNDATSPNTKFHDGTASNLAVHVDSAAGCQATEQFDVTTPGGPSPAVTRPSNDMFANAITVTGSSGSTTKNTQHATTEPGEPKPAGAGRASVWYRWTAPVSGTATIQTTDSDYDTVLGIYTGSAVNALTEIGSNDDQVPGSVFTSKVTKHVTAGTTYQIAADGYGGDSGNLKLSWSLVADPPTAKLATTTTASAPKKVRYKKDFDVTANVTAGAAGTVTVMEGTKVLGTGTLSNGTVKIRVKKNLKPGKHTLTVSYGGSATHLASSTTVKVKVKKRRHHR